MDAPRAARITLSEAELADLTWTKARASTHNGACVEIAATANKIAMRDSKDPDGAILVYTPVEFRAFLDGARNGEFDRFVQLVSTGLFGRRGARIRVRPPAFHQLPTWRLSRTEAGEDGIITNSGAGPG